jgi:hypothetical protein
VAVILAQQRRPVGAVQCVVAEPRRQRAACREARLRPWRDGHAGVAQIVEDLRFARVGETPSSPLVAHRDPVRAQRLLEPLPHEHRRMMLPAVDGSCQCPHDLQRLDALLAEPPDIEGARRLVEVGVREERLHGVTADLSGALTKRRRPSPP